MAYTKYSLTPANNTAAPPDGAPEGMLPSAVNDTMRDMMAQIRDVGDGVRDGTYTMTAPKITGGTITGVAITSSTGSFTTLSTSSTTTFSGLTASTALALDASKNVVSVTNTGTGNNVLSASPTLTGTIAGASLSLSSLTSGRVTYAGASGLLSDSANLTWDNTNARLGIGTTSPSDTLSVIKSTMTNQIVMGLNTTDTTYGSISFSGSNSGPNRIGITGGGGSDKSLYIDVPSTGNHYFRNNAAIGMFLNDGGNLGLGVQTTPQGRLAIGVTGMSNQLILGQNTSNALYGAIAFNGNNADGSRLGFTGGGTGDNTLYIDVPTGGQYAFRRGATQAMTLDANGSLALGGTTVASSNGGMTITCTSSGSSSAPLTLRNAGTANGSGVYLIYRGVTNTGAENDYGYFNMVADDTTAKTSSMRFSTANGSSPVERMRITSAGNVGIGTSSPSCLLEVNQAATSFPGFKISGSSSPGMQIVDTSGVTAHFANDSAGTYFGTTTSNPLIFRTVNTERMRLDSDGHLLVNTTSDFNSAFTMSLKVNSSTGGLIIQPGANDYTAIQFNNAAGTGVGSISVSSTLTSYNVTSDQRLKTNIVDAPSGNIDGIKVRSFDWVLNGSHQEYGMVAQELIEVAPYAVTKPKNPDDMMQVDYSKLVPMMIKEIQELKQRIATLENK